MNNKRSRRSKKRTLSRPIFTLVLFSFSAFIGLGFFRFTASRINTSISGIEASIREYDREAADLERSYSTLTSPITIYRYCKENLGMYAAKQEEMRLPRLLTADTAVREHQKGWRSSMLAFFGFTAN